MRQAPSEIKPCDVHIMDRVRKAVKEVTRDLAALEPIPVEWGSEANALQLHCKTPTKSGAS